MSMYVLTSEIFEFLVNQQVDADEEMQLNNTIYKLNEIQQVFASDFEGTRYDVSETLGII